VSFNYDPEDQEWEVGAHGFYEVSAPPSVGDRYTFHIEYADGSSEQVEREIRAIPPPNAPTITSPSGFTVTPTDGEVTISWDYDTSVFADASFFQVEFWSADHFYQIEHLPLDARSVTFPATELMDGWYYRLDVLIEDVHGNTSEGIKWVTFQGAE
jgi:hypothetical protein